MSLEGKKGGVEIQKAEDGFLIEATWKSRYPCFFTKMAREERDSNTKHKLGTSPGTIDALVCRRIIVVKQLLGSFLVPRLVEH